MDRNLETQPRGVLNPKAREAMSDLQWYAPRPELADLVEFYWVVSWDLRGSPPYRQETLPHPALHLVFEPGRSGLYGILAGKFGRILQDQGRVFAVKFRPAGFYPFVQTPMTVFADKVHSLHDIFGEEGGRLEAAVLGETADAGRIEVAERFLVERLPEPDAMVATVNALVEQIRTDRAVLKVEDIAQRAALSKRSVQRLFRQYVGVSPKWVIQRYRLHEAAERLAADPHLDLAQLAAELGYFDQPHFIKDFKALVGKTPADYAHAAVTPRT